jgi:hypothetical protein
MNYQPADPPVTRRNLLRISAVVVPAIALGTGLPTAADAASAKPTPPVLRAARPLVSLDAYVC